MHLGSGYQKTSFVGINANICRFPQPIVKTVWLVYYSRVCGGPVVLVPILAGAVSDVSAGLARQLGGRQSDQPHTPVTHRTSPRGGGSVEVAGRWEC